MKEKEKQRENLDKWFFFWMLFVVKMLYWYCSRLLSQKQKHTHATAKPHALKCTLITHTQQDREKAGKSTFNETHTEREEKEREIKMMEIYYTKTNEI